MASKRYYLSEHSTKTEGDEGPAARPGRDPMDLFVSYYIMHSAITIILTSLVLIERNNEFFYLEVKSFNGSFIINN